MSQSTTPDKGWRRHRNKIKARQYLPRARRFFSVRPISLVDLRERLRQTARCDFPFSASLPVLPALFQYPRYPYPTASLPQVPPIPDHHPNSLSPAYPSKEKLIPFSQRLPFCSRDSTLVYVRMALFRTVPKCG